MEKMLRGIIISLAVLLSLNVVCARAGITRHADVNSLMDVEELTMLEPTIRQTREIGSILSAVKSQFREALQDIFNEAWRSLRTFTTQTRDRLLRQLESFTFSDVLRGLINAFFGTDFEPETYVDTVVKPVVVEPVQVEPVEVVYRNSLTSLFNH